MSKFNELINAETPTLVDFMADWCGPCQAMAPILSDVKAEMGDRIRIVKINVDKNQAIASKFGIRGVPTLIVFKKGEAVWRQSGLMQKNELIPIIEQNL